MGNALRTHYPSPPDAETRPVPGLDTTLVPPLIALLGDVRGQMICDLGCGSGALTRVLAERGARMLGIDLSVHAIGLAERAESAAPLGIRYLVDDALLLRGMSEASFDGVLCHLALMEMADLEAALRSVWRILRPTGWFVFSIPHPCFQAPHARWLTSADGAVSREVQQYFEEGYWRSMGLAPGRVRYAAYHRTLASYLNALVQHGFVVEQLLEPQLPAGAAEQQADYSCVPAFLLVRCHKRLSFLGSLARSR